MMARFLKISLFTFALTALASLGDASVAHALHCGTTLVAAGDAMARVRANCGSPTTAVSRTEVRTTSGNTYGVSPGAVIAVTVQIDQWTYDFGRLRLMEEITFENGVVRSMRSIGYGTREGTPRSILKRADSTREKAILEPRRAGAVPRA